MRAWFACTGAELLGTDDAAVAGALARAQMSRRLAGEPTQLHAWQREASLLRALVRALGGEAWTLAFEFDLLRLLVEAAGVPVSRDDISATVFRRRFRAEDRTVDNLVLRLRRKLGSEQERAIKTVRGAGYMFAGFEAERLMVA